MASSGIRLRRPVGTGGGRTAGPTGVAAADHRDRFAGGGRAARAVLERHPLAALLLLAASLRLWAASVPGFHHPDAIYQYLEPAHRLLTGDGVVTWEWRVGMRSWLLPLLLAGPAWLGERIDPAGELAVALPRAAMGSASLGIVWAAWRCGARLSRTHAAITGFVAATWFEFVYFGAQTLAEPLAAAAILAAAALLTGPAPDRPGRPGRPGRPDRNAIVAAGALIAVAVMLRPHYAPSCAVLVAVAGGRDRWRWCRPLALGALAAAAIGGAVDLAAGSVPFAWAAENLRQNVMEHRAARYGVAPPLAYLAWYVELWRWWAIPMLVGLQAGWRRAPALAAVAVTTLAVHSLIGHKEYRFVFLATAALVIVAALGWAEIACRRRPPSRRGRRLAIGVAAAWGLASLALAHGPVMAAFAGEGRAGSRLAAAIRADAASCGVALVGAATFADVPGGIGLRRGTPLLVLADDDPASAGAGGSTVVARAGGAFNRLVLPAATPLPAGYRTARCEPWDGDRLCLAVRDGGCAAAARSPYAVNAALARLGF